MMKALLVAILALLALAAHPALAQQQSRKAAPSVRRGGVRGRGRGRGLSRNGRTLQKNDNNNNKDNNNDAVTIIDILGDKDNEDDYSILEGLLQDADLTETLQSDGPFTVLAPTNAAFEALDPATLTSVQEDPDLLRQVLLYHVLAGNISSVDLLDLLAATEAEAGSSSSSVSVATLNTANNLTVTTANNNITTVNNAIAAAEAALLVFNDNATVVQADIMASNGVIHSVDTVLIPEVVQTQAPAPEEAPAPPEEEEEEEGLGLEELFTCVVDALGTDPVPLFAPELLECGVDLAGLASGEFDLEAVVNCIGTTIGCEAAAGVFDDVVPPPTQQSPPEDPETSQAGMTMGQLFDGV